MVLVVLLSLLLASPSPAAAQQRPVDRRTWYQAYQDGRQQVQKKDWAAAIASLTVAREKGPAPGRRVPFYGDVYDDFLPDYYLGIAYLNTGRDQEAMTAFAAVQKSGLITQKDHEFGEFNTQLTAVTKRIDAARAAQVARQTTPTGSVPPSTGPTQSAANNAGPVAVDIPDTGNLGLANNAATSPATSTAATVATPDRPVATPVAPTGTSGKAPGDRTAASVPPPVRPGVPVQNTLPPAGTSGRVAEQIKAMTAFYSGDYKVAADLFLALAGTRAATRRDEFYLACSHAALVLTGQADRRTLDDVQARFTQIDGAEFAADARLVSPRILSLLRTKPTQ